MKNYNEIKESYVKDHLSQPLKAPNIRLKALENIESAIKSKDLTLLNETNLFTKFTEDGLRDFYLKLKGKNLNSAEKSVIHGLYKFYAE